MGSRLSENDRQARLAETKPCKFCGKPVSIWKAAPDGRLYRYKGISCGCQVLENRKLGGIHLSRLNSAKVAPEIVQRRLSETLPCLNCGKHICMWFWIFDPRYQTHRLSRRQLKEGKIFCNVSCMLSYNWNNSYWNGGPFFNHRLTTKLVSVFGEEKNLYQWSKDSRCVVVYWTLKTRVRLGWELEAAITTPPKTRGKRTKNRTEILESKKQAEALMQDVISSLTAAVVK